MGTEQGAGTYPPTSRPAAAHVHHTEDRMSGRQWFSLTGVLEKCISALPTGPWGSCSPAPPNLPVFRRASSTTGGVVKPRLALGPRLEGRPTNGHVEYTSACQDEVVYLETLEAAPTSSKLDPWD